MKPVLFLDTHVVAWLYAGRVVELSAHGKALIEERVLFVSSAVELELGALYERGMVRVPAPEIIDDLASRLGLTLSTAPLSRIARKSHELAWASDLFDRLICAEVELSEASLLTKDAIIHSHFPRAVW